MGRARSFLSGLLLVLSAPVHAGLNDGARVFLTWSPTRHETDVVAAGETAKLYVRIVGANDVRNARVRLRWSLGNGSECIKLVSGVQDSVFCGDLVERIDGLASRWRIEFNGAPRNLIRYTFDLAGCTETQATFMLDFVEIVDAIGSVVYARSDASVATINGGAVDVGAIAPELLHMDTVVAVEGFPVKIDELYGSNLPPSLSVLLRRQEDGLTYQPDYLHVEPHRLEARFSTLPGDEGTWDVVASHQGFQSQLESKVIVHETGGSGSAAILDPANMAEYIIITGDAFIWEAHHLRSHILSRSYNRLQDVFVVGVNDLMSTFAADDTTSIREFLKYAHNEWASMPQYILLLGDADRAGGASDVVPTLYREARPGPSGATFAYDDGYALLEGDDDYPDVVIARIPARTGLDVTNYLSKLIRYDALSRDLPWSRRVLFGVGDRGGSVNRRFTDGAERVVSTVAPEFVVATEFAHEHGFDYESFEAALRGRLDDGQLLFNAYGNTGSSRDLVFGLDYGGTLGGPFLTSDLGNEDRYFLLCALTCVAHAFDRSNPSICIGTHLLCDDPDVGAIASISVTNNIFHVPMEDVNSHLIDQLIEAPQRRSVGSAFWTAKARSLALWRTHKREVQMLSLLGDPALELNRVPDRSGSFLESGFELSQPLAKQNAIWAATAVSEATARIVGKSNGNAAEGVRSMRLGHDAQSSNSIVDYSLFEGSWTIDEFARLSFRALVEETAEPHGLVTIDGVLASGGLVSGHAAAPVDQHGTRLLLEERTTPIGSWVHYYVDLVGMGGERIDRWIARFGGRAAGGIARAFVDDVRFRTGSRFDGYQFLSNTSFEDDVDRDGVPDFWSGYRLQASASIAAVNDADSQGGSRSVVLTPVTGQTNAMAQATSLPVGAVVVGFWAKTDDPGAYDVSVELTDKHNPSNQPDRQTVVVSDQWSYSLLSMQVPPGQEQSVQCELTFVLAGDSTRYWFDDVELTLPSAIGQSAPELVPGFGFMRVRPNPFNPTAEIVLGLDGESADAKLRVFNVRGRVVDTIVLESARPGIHRVNWTPTALASGRYYLQLLAADGRSAVQSITLVR